MKKYELTVVIFDDGAIESEEKSDMNPIERIGILTLQQQCILNKMQASAVETKHTITSQKN